MICQTSPKFFCFMGLPLAGFRFQKNVMGDKIMLNFD